MRHFESIPRYKGYFHDWSPDDIIVVTEKLDGANASVRFRVEHGTIASFTCHSRRQELSEENTLRGFYQYANDELLPKISNMFCSHEDVEYILYGEWLVSHAVKYKEEFHSKFYLFSVYDVTNDKYIHVDKAMHMAECLGIDTPQILSEGNLRDFTIEDFVKMSGKSNMTMEEDCGEGIVVTNLNRLEITPDNCRIKFISDKFSEKTNNKPHRARSSSESEEWISQFLTESRVNKALHKLNDEGAFPEIELKNFKDIASPTVEFVYDDIISEESDSLPECYEEREAKRFINKRAPVYIRQFIESYYL